MGEKIENSTENRNPKYTYFKDIYPLFLNSIDSYDLSRLDDNELSETLKGYLMAGVLVFDTYIDKDFSDINEKEECFNFKLTRQEMNILAKAMKLEWVRMNKHSEELIRKAYGDRDFNVTQGYRYLDELQIMETQLTKEIRTEVNELEYANADLYGDMA
ncbi:hypothetical protein [Limosilactobacillus reuteri]|uniref:Uncharacterized protein n=1 Tax=Limosilactobacillus reuteri TaxID=1598 RepID=A0ABD6Y763_LIMRT|nr:hypothetical protein [Limosilactobacillus reuteri]PWT37672.1 hypothetical protein DKZ35_04120 [Limosilactobacillus reuteri]